MLKHFSTDIIFLMRNVTAAIIKKDSRVLLTRRGPRENLAGMWEFPGGKIEVGETPEECLKRELHEELDIDTTITKFFAETSYKYTDGEIKLLFFNAEINNGRINLKVHDKYEWVAINDLTKYDLLPADIPIANKLLEEVL